MVDSPHGYYVKDPCVGCVTRYATIPLSSLQQNIPSWPSLLPSFIRSHYVCACMHACMCACVRVYLVLFSRHFCLISTFFSFFITGIIYHIALCVFEGIISIVTPHSLPFLLAMLILLPSLPSPIYHTILYISYPDHIYKHYV